MDEDMNKSNNKKSSKMIISLLIGSSPIFLVFFALFVSVLIVLGFFDIESEASGYNGGYESGSFVVYDTLLGKDEFSEQLKAAVSKYPSLKVFADNADDIYDIALSEGVNPELVVVRAISEGFKPGTGYNYWGINCTNTGDGSDCESYDSFNNGVRRFVSIVSEYSSILDMMSHYSYIGDYWYNPGSAGVGGCHYASYIYDEIPSRVQEACTKVCSVNDTSNCVATTDEDQNAYAIWQVAQMTKIRDSIFSIDVDTNTDDNQSDGSSSSNVSTINIMSMSDDQAWSTLTGYSSRNEAEAYVNEATMNSKMVNITVPIRVWASSNANDYSTKKSYASIRVNKALASLYTSFFNEIYEQTGSDDNLFVINPSEIYCYSFRRTTSGTRLSAHAYGAACDVNWSTNGNGYGEHVYTKSEWKRLRKSKAKYQIVYKDSKVVEIAHRYTLSWGGEWSSVTDAMHFSFIGDESRATLQTKY